MRFLSTTALFMELILLEHDVKIPHGTLQTHAMPLKVALKVASTPGLSAYFQLLKDARVSCGDRGATDGTRRKRPGPGDRGVRLQD